MGDPIVDMATFAQRSRDAGFQPKMGVGAANLNGVNSALADLLPLLGQELTTLGVPLMITSGVDDAPGRKPQSRHNPAIGGAIDVGIKGPNGYLTNEQQIELMTTLRGKFGKRFQFQNEKDHFHIEQALEDQAVQDLLRNIGGGQ